MNYEALILDIDGTLWDSRALVAEGYNIQLKKEGLEHLFVTAEDLLPLFGKVMTEIADVILASIPEADRYDLMERCMATENKYLEENPCRIGYPAFGKPWLNSPRNTGFLSSATASAAIPNCASRNWISRPSSAPICASVTPAPPRDRPFCG